MPYKIPEKYRLKFPEEHPYHSKVGEKNGAFAIPVGGGIVLMCLATEGDETIPWEHVSVSVSKVNNKGKTFALDRCPKWEEMCTVKAGFWDAEDTVVQFHPPESEYVSQHKYVLHLWRKQGENFETPPSIAVGTKKGQDL